MNINKKMLENIPAWMEKQDDIPVGWAYIGDDKERYLLGQSGAYNLLIFGINPSTASVNENNLDQMTRKVKKIAKAEGYDGWLIVNIYPLRETDPFKLPRKPDKDLVENNLKVLEAVEKNYTIGKIWAVWGDSIDTQFYLGDGLYDIQNVINSDQCFYRGTN